MYKYLITAHLSTLCTFVLSIVTYPDNLSGEVHNSKAAGSGICVKARKEDDDDEE